MLSTFRKVVDVPSPIHIKYFAQSWSGTQIRVMPKHVTFDHLVGSESPKQNIGRG
jgi:hypothetical protein